MIKLINFTPSPEKSHYYEIFQIIHGKSKKIACVASLAICLTLTSCSQAPNASDITPKENSMTEQESPQKYITQMDFSNDDEFWEYAEKEYPITPIEEIRSGSKKREMILVDAIFLDVQDENSLTKKYYMGYKNTDGTYECFSETFKPSSNKLMTDISLLDSLTQGDLVRICALIPNGDYVDFDTMYGLKIIGHDDETVKIALNISDNPLMNLKVQTGNVMNGMGDTVLGERAFSRMDKEDIRNITSEQYTEFVDKKIKDSGYNWYSIIFTDGTGIQWAGSDPGNAVYGKMDLEGCVTEPEGYIQIRDGKYSYLPPTGN